MTARVEETDQPATYSCGDCFREWIVGPCAQATSVTKEGSADLQAITTVTTALEALQNVSWR